MADKPAAVHDEAGREAELATAFRQINQPIRKLDGQGMVLGRPLYTCDLVPPQALVIKVLRSPHPFARIRQIDTREALASPGVVCVLTAADLPRRVHTRAGQGYPEPSPYDKFILDDYVRYCGDEVAAVAAVSEKAALAARDRIVVDYEVLPPVLDFETAEGHASIIHPEPEIQANFDIGLDPARNIAAAYEMQVGDVNSVLADCDVVVKERYYIQAQAHVMMEPHAAVTYLDLHGRLVVIATTQTPFHVRRIIARTLDIPLHRIRVIKPRLGGGFGGKQALHGELIAAAVTLKTGRPARLEYTRQEVFESTYTRHQTRIDLTLGAMRDGRLRAMDMDILLNTGAYGEHALTVMMVVGSKSLPLYNKVDAVHFKGRAVYTNQTPAGAFRGYGAVQGMFALESAMDVLAERLSIDPIRLRRQNMIAEGETSPIFQIMGEGGEGVAMTVDSCKLDYCLQRGLQLVDWPAKYPRRQITPDKVRGVGLAIAMQASGLPAIDMGSAIIKLNDDGFFNLLVGATDLGTGSDTILAQIAAETLAVPTASIVVYAADTDLTPFDTGAYASSTTYISGHAVKQAAENLRQAIIRAGARRLQVAETAVLYDGQAVSRRDGQGQVSLRELATGLFYSNNQEQLAGIGSYVGQKSPPPYMAGLAEVEVDLGTGQVILCNYTAVVDCGTTINPSLARIQVEGALAQGIGLALYEEVRRSPQGALLTNSLLSYALPTRQEIRNIVVEFADSYEPSGPYGAKSVAEIGIDTPPAAIANAIYNACGIRLRSLPFTAEKVLLALQAQNKPAGEQSFR